jgi:hypothetical protein
MWVKTYGHNRLDRTSAVWRSPSRRTFAAMARHASPTTRQRRGRPGFELDGSRMVLFAALLVSAFLTSMVPEGAQVAHTVADHPAQHLHQQAPRR